MRALKSENSVPLDDFNPVSQWVLLLSLVVSILVVDFSSIFGWIAIGIAAGLLLRISRVPLRQLLKHLMRFYPMIFIMTLLLPFTAAKFDETVFTIAGYDVYRQGLRNFMVVNMKSILLLILFFAVVQSTGLESLARLFQKIGAKRAAVVVLFLTRFVELLKAELSRSFTAFKARKISMSRWHTVKSFAGLVSVYFVRLLERSERNYLSLSARGFNGRICITGSQVWSWRDKLTLLFSAGLVMVVAWNGL